MSLELNLFHYQNQSLTQNPYNRDSMTTPLDTQANQNNIQGQIQTDKITTENGKESQLTLVPLEENSGTASAVLRAIKEASIPANENTMKMVSAMMEQGMSIDKNSLLGMFRKMNGLEQVDPEAIVAMTKQGIPVNQESMEQFVIYRNNEHQIIELATDLAEQFGTLAAENGSMVTGELLNIFQGEVPPALLQEMKDNIAAMLIPEENAGKDGNVPETEALNQQDTPKTLGDIMREMQEMQSVQNTQGEEAAAELEEETDIRPLAVENPDSELGRILNADSRTALAELLGEFGAPEQVTTGLLSGEMPVKQLMQTIQAAISLVNQNEELPDAQSAEQLKKFIEGKDFQKLVAHTLTEQWSLKPEDVNKKEHVEELYQKLVAQTEKTSTLLSQIGKENSPLMKGIDNLKQNVSFMNQLNELYTYVQLPLKLSGENAHGDLYVYTNKKKLAEKDGEVTALLHLEMKQLGTMDIHVALKNENDVKTHFYLQKEEMLDFIEENIHLLDERLTKRGYHMKIDASVRKPEGGNENANPVMDEMLGKKKEGLVAKYSFDVRA